MRELDVYEVKIDENFADTFLVALVDDPAIESNFIYFSANKPIKYVFNEEKMIISGPAMIPNKKIYRNDSYGEYEVFFSEETIRKFVEVFNNKKEKKFNIMHNNNEQIELNIIESYFAKENNEFGVTAGSWIITAKVKDSDTWKKIKSDILKGFSIQGVFVNELVSFNKQNNKFNKKMDLKAKIIEAISTILFAEEKEPVVEPVEPIVEPIVEPVVEPVVDPVEPIEPEDKVVEPEEDKVKIEDINKIIDEKVNELKSLIEELNKKIDVIGNQPVVTEKPVETINNPVVEHINPASRFFPKK